MSKQETVLLAHTYKEGKHLINSGYVSEKLDGMRAIYIPWTRGMKKKDVPFANTAKDERLLEEEICTGLWSRYFNCIHAPDWWLDQLPNLIMDGELYSEVMPRQDLMSIVKKKKQNVATDEEWDKVSLFVFSLPHYTMLFKQRHAYNAQVNLLIDCLPWAESKIASLDYHSKAPLYFKQEASLIPKKVSGRAIPHKQFLLPTGEERAKEIVFAQLEKVSARGGEGLMLRRPFSVWDTCRSHDIIKFKKLDDAEAVVVGYQSGKITDKDSRNRGLVGALHLEMPCGTKFTIGGMRDTERTLTEEWEEWAFDHPDTRFPDEVNSGHWPKGTVITYQYRGTSKDGVPNEARIWRKHEGH